MDTAASHREATTLDDTLFLKTEDGVPYTLDQIERAVIRAALARAPSTMQAARDLGVGRSTLYRKMRHYDLWESRP